MKLFDRDSLPPELRPLSNRQLAVGLVVCLVILFALGGCGGGDHEPDDHTDDRRPQCALHPEVCR